MSNKNWKHFGSMWNEMGKQWEFQKQQDRIIHEGREKNKREVGLMFDKD